MNIGIAGPITIAPFRHHFANIENSSGPLPVGMGGTPVVNLVSELLHRGRRVTVFTLDEAVDSEVVLQGERLKICIGPYRRRHRARDLFAVERAYIRQAIRREKPDIVHAHWTYEFALGALESNAPTLVTAHDAPWYILRFDPSPYRAMRTVMAYQVARRATHMTAVSQYVANHFRSMMRYRGSLAVVPNALPAEAIALGAETRKKSGDFLTFACILPGWGRLKNTRVALRAFSKVRRTLPTARLLMFGVDHGQGEAANVWAAERRLTDGVTFVGSVPYGELLRRLSFEVDVLVHPSLEESFGMVLAEAMALGIPVIAGECSGGTRFVLDEGRAGLLTDVRSPRKLSEVMLRFAGAEMRQEYGELGRRSVQQRFRADVVTDAYENAYKAIAVEPNHQ